MADWDLYQLLRHQGPADGNRFLAEHGLSQQARHSGWERISHTNGTVSWDIRGRSRAGSMRGGFTIRELTTWVLTAAMSSPTRTTAGRVYWRHRQNLPEGWQVTAKLGLISDRNFLEEYYEKEWDEWVDRVTSLELKRTWEDQSLRVLGQFSLNDNVSQTEWWPRGDHFLLGRSLLQDHLTWYATFPGQLCAVWSPRSTDGSAGRHGLAIPAVGTAHA